MIVVMRIDASEEEIARVSERIIELGFKPHLSRGVERTVIGAIGHELPQLKDMLEVLPGVAEVIPILKPYKLASRDFQRDDTLIKIGDVTIGGEEVMVIAGPCAVETEVQVLETAHAVKAAGANILRGGAYKPSTSLYDFRGLGKEVLKILDQARTETSLPIITEVLTPSDVELVSRYADILQVGARNMQNFALLEEVGRANVPVMLKRGMSATIEE